MKYVVHLTIQCMCYFQHTSNQTSIGCGCIKTVVNKISKTGTQFQFSFKYLFMVISECFAVSAMNKLVKLVKVAQNYIIVILHNPVIIGVLYMYIPHSTVHKYFLWALTLESSENFKLHAELSNNEYLNKI